MSIFSVSFSVSLLWHHSIHLQDTKESVVCLFFPKECQAVGSTLGNALHNILAIFEGIFLAIIKTVEIFSFY